MTVLKPARYFLITWVTLGVLVMSSVLLLYMVGGVIPLIVHVGLLLVLLFVAIHCRARTLALATNITKNLRHERHQAVATQQKVEAILSSIGDAVFVVDTQKRITLFNPAAEKISGYRETEALGQPCHKILDFRLEATDKPSHGFIDEALAGKAGAMEVHTFLIRKDGGRVQVSDSAAPIYDAAGKVSGVIVVFRDTTQERALEKAKDELVSLVSHQLRTPLTAISWYGEMLLNNDAGELNPMQREYLGEVNHGNQRMIALVNSLLNVSRLDLGKMANNPELLDIPDMLASLKKELHNEITSKHLTYQVHVHPDIGTMQVDPKLMRMILQNLLSNAVKYTPKKGAVTVRVDPSSANGQPLSEPTSAPVKHLLISVADTGYGIPRHQQTKIFSKLFRADNVQKLGVEGTGLGLYIVKEVAEKLGGRVWFKSIESIGTTFYVVLPLLSAVSSEHLADRVTT